MAMNERKKQKSSMLKDNKSIWSMLKQPNKTGNSNNKKTSETKKKTIKNREK